MSSPPLLPTAPAAPVTPVAPVVPSHWTAEQALAVAECLKAIRQALWATDGQQMQVAWRAQPMPDQAPSEFDPNEPF